MRAGPRARSRRAYSALVLGVLAACGIDQGGRDAPGGSLASGTTLVVAGPISGFGSVLVNDLRLDASAAQIRIDGRFATEAELAVGQMIRAIAIEQADGLHAVSIEHRANLIGPIETVDAQVGALTVLGQAVSLDAATALDASITDLASLRAGESIAVSGLTLPSGGLLATHLRRADAAATQLVTAPITALDEASARFEIGALTVDYSQALLLELPEGAPEIGLLVEVTGDATTGVLIASEIHARQSLPGFPTPAATSLTAFEQPLVTAALPGSSVAASFVGFVTTSAWPASITLGDIEVSIDKTTLVGGGTGAGLAIGAKVLVEGRIDALGRIAAQRIKLL